MKPALWRPAALTFIAVAIVFVLYHMTLPDRQNFGLTFAASNTASGDKRVEAVERNSAAARAGIHRGDVVSYGSNEIQRATFLYATPGSHVTVTVNGTRRVTFTGLKTAPIFIPGAAAIRLAFLLVAALLAWRRPEDAATRALVTFLWCFGVAVSLPNGVLPTPLLSLIFLQSLSLLLFFFGMGAAANFSARFPSGVAVPAARILAGIAQWLAVIASLAVVGVEFLNSSVTKSLTLNAPFFALFFVIGALVVATLIVAYVQGAPTDRPRRRWIFLLLGVGLGGPLVDVFVQAVFGLNPWVDELSLVPLGLLPLGLAYVILRHRVIDVGFVINRALVFAGVSAVLVAVFVLVETLLSKYVEQISHTGSVVVQLAVALILGFSVRAIHARVERFIDAVFFRDRHVAEAAVRDFSHDAPYITDAGLLLARCVTMVERYARARGAGVWLARGNQYIPAKTTFDLAKDVGENDAAVLAMRARRVSVDLIGSDSALPGALALPMIVRGELTGILVCGTKPNDEAYAPDERDVLATLAGSAGSALDAIEVRELRRRFEALGALRDPPPA